jgi:hypothetical protein
MVGRVSRTIKGIVLRDIVHQHWSFSPQGSTREVEDYQGDLSGV